MTRTFAIAAIGLLLTSCASYNWAPGPNAVTTDFNMQKAQCSLMARNGERGFVAVGSPSYVAGASIGNAIGEGVRTQTNFNDCMMATGWTPVSQR